MIIRLPDILFFFWLLFLLVTGFFQQLISVGYLFPVSLFLFFYLTGRANKSTKWVEKVFTALILVAALVCFFYLYADITIFQQQTVLSPNSSIIAIQVAILTSLAIFLFRQAQIRWLKLVLSFCIISFVFLLMLLQSRTAIIALLAAMLYMLYPNLRKWYTQKSIIFLSSCFLICVIMFLAFSVKIYSSQGRWLIWKNSFQLLKKNWLTGTGVGLFNPSYNHLQADYFSQHSLTDKKAMLANDGYYAFNEWLHIGVEQGTLGLLFFVAVTIVILSACFKNVRTEYSFPGSVIILVTVASLFSYPSHNWLLLSAIAFFTGMIGRQTRIVRKIEGSSKIAALGLIVSAIFLFFTSYNWLSATNKFSKAETLQKEGYKTDAYNLFFQSKSVLKSHPAFTFFYLNLLYETGRLKEAIKWENEFHKYHCNQKAHAVIAKCFAETGNFEEAEMHFYTSLYITPHLLQSRMDLVDFYNQKKDTVKAKYWAQLLLDCPVKIPTDRAWYLKEKANEYLKTH